MVPGASQQFTATGQFSDGSSRVLTTSLTWSTSDASVASISNTGLANALVAGVVTITAKSGTISGTATLNVTGAARKLGVH